MSQALLGLLLALLLGGFGLRGAGMSTDVGGRWDPNGATSETDVGGRWDPNG